MTTSGRRVVTIIVHYGSVEETLRCVMTAASASGIEHMIQVVDNSGTFPEAVDFPDCDVRIVKSGRNAGFAAGVNLGYQNAIGWNPDFIHLLNNDTCVVNPAYVRELTDYLRDHPDVACAGPLVLMDKDGSPQQTILQLPSLGQAVRLAVSWRVAKLRRTPKETPSSAIKVDCLNFVCALIRASAFGQLGGLNEALFMYGEEADFCFRLKRSGLGCAYVPVLSVRHRCGATGGGRNGLAYYYTRRNLVYLISRQKGRIPAFLLAVGLTGAHFLRVSMNAAVWRRAWGLAWDLHCAASGILRCSWVWDLQPEVHSADGKQAPFTSLEREG